MGFRADFSTAGWRSVIPEPAFGPPSSVDPGGRRAVLRLAAAETVTVAQVGPRELVVRVTRERRPLVGRRTRFSPSPRAVGSRTGASRILIPR